MINESGKLNQTKIRVASKGFGSLNCFRLSVLESYSFLLKEGMRDEMKYVQDLCLMCKKRCKLRINWNEQLEYCYKYKRKNHNKRRRDEKT